MVIKLAKVAPAPKATNKAGRAQQTSVDEEANKEKKLADLSYMIKALTPVSYTHLTLPTKA